MVLLVHEDTVDPEDSVPIPQASPLCWAVVPHVADDVPGRVLLNAQEEAVFLLGLLGHCALPGLQGRSHLYQTGWEKYL